LGTAGRLAFDEGEGEGARVDEEWMMMIDDD
jgi:hypothetical protein